MDYKSARLISANGKLQKNKGVMIVGNGTTILGLNGLSGGNWVNSQASIVTASGSSTIIIPVMVYGITLGSAAAFELN